MSQSISRSHPLFFSLFATLFFIAISFTNPYTAAPYIVWDLGGDTTISVYTISFFGVGSALSVPLGKFLISRIHVRQVLIYCTLSMALTTLLCGLSPNYPIFIICRFLLGFSAGPLYSALNFALSNLIEPEKKPAALSMFIMILTIVPVLGTCIGGTIAYEYNWRWLCFVNIPFLLVLAYMQAVFFKEIDLTMEKKPFDGIGYFFFCVGTFCITFCIITAQQLDWQRSPLLVTMMIIGIPSFLFYILWSLYHPNPLLELRMLKNPTFAFAMISLAVLFSTYFGMLSLLSLWLKLYVNYTPYWIAVGLGTMAVVGILPKFLVEGSLSKIDQRIPLGLAIILLAISCFHTATFDVEINFGRLAFSRAIAGLGLALFLPPIFQMSFRSFPSDKSVDVIEIFQVVRNVAAGIGASSFDILWQRRQVFFHERLGEGLNVFAMQTKEFYAKAAQLRVSEPTNELAHLLDRRSTSLALDDCFWLMGWLLIALLLSMIFTLRWTKAR
jgi:DHA2 family multidrug resistance protein